ncbi:Outer membrane porin F precursor [Pseudomonas oleovorans subsp. oleovorans]|jgi:OOP family OmpA-OmpF porin|uniref:OmpF family protein n=2 Tax=Ectopseudomonas oleovorans TaxID=301 RepID=A0A379JZH6_ECTOL|nr:OmpA family protein [Pseudomonas oleovorans]OWK44100.1 Outer membrane porin F precursor [Pseudomonas oleovorans subsp. oleovorans]PZP80952.1 MAG: OmpA family protein [Pseudomonas oleovorans]PZQ42463.1 MAG: OmpA family protein [Pseudomonas oleovorans]SEJ51834.1 OmpA-OmpF porin, OOP family [Pseudomonas oleovorans]SUD53393.1 OmpF family protein [Pseudomonas oleovorans]
MKVKNTLGVVIGSLVAATSFGALAQGQGAVEVEGFVNRYFTDVQRDYAHNEGNLFGGSIGYYLTDDVELALSYGEYHDLRGEGSRGSKNIKGNLTDLKAIYHFGQPGVGLRPYVSAGFGHQSIGDANGGGRNRSTLAIAGAGAKYYFTEMFYARAGVDALYNIDQGDTEWQAGVGVGLNFGGGSKPAPAPAPVVAAAPEPMPEPAPEPALETVRVELDVKFDFDKDRVKEESYGDIKNLADFMNQYPQTTTTVEGHTDSIGSDAYNQGLSERRANAVRNVLVNQYGVDGSRVNAVGYGKTRPVADNATDAGRAINRRVEAEVEAQIQQ